MTAGDRARLWLGDIVACLIFFTRLPLAPTQMDGRRFADALWAAPVAGFAVGLIGGVAFWTAAELGLPATVAAALALATTLLVTGCLHEDGLADVADGFGGGRGREAKLAIMKDSRIGSYGVAALAFSILLRWSVLAALADPTQVCAALIAAHMAARAVLPAFMMLVKPARPGGLSAGAGEVGAGTADVAILIGALALLPLGFAGALVAAGLLALCCMLLKRLCENQIGGQTGDVLGLLEQVAEIATLLVACALLR